MRVLANASVMLGCRILADSLNVLLFVVVSRRFGPEGVGAYSYGFAVAGFIWAATVLGIEDYGVREYLHTSGERRRALIADLIGLQLGIGAATFCALALFLGATAPSDHTAFIVVALSIYQLCNALAATLFVPAMAEQQMVHQSLMTLAARSFAFCSASALLVLAEVPLSTAIAIFPIAGLFYLVGAVLSARGHLGQLAVHLSLATMRSALRSMWSFATVEILGQLLARVSIVVLALRLGEQSAGIYATGLKIVEVACLPIWFLTLAAYPDLCRRFGHPDFKQASTRILRSSILLSAGLALAIYFIVPHLLVPVLGAAYEGTQQLVAVTASIGVMFGIEICLGRILFAKHLHTLRAATVGVAGVVCAVANAVAVPRYGVAGAIYATAASYGLLNLIYTFGLRKPGEQHLLSRPVVSP